jgi:predicted dehydrogenase
LQHDTKFSVALLGCGAVVQDLYLPVLKSLSGQIHVKWCVDIDAENCRRVAAELNATAVTGGVERLLASSQADGVIVSIPNKHHANAIVDCLAAGCHVFCEKPVATHSDECDRIENAIAGADRVLTVNLLRRCFPATRSVRHLIRTEALGRLAHIEVAEGGRGGWNSRTGFQFVRDSSGGGVTMDRGSHIFDLLVHWCGKPTVSSYADDAEGGCESTSITELQWPNDTRAVVRMSKTEPWESCVTVDGELGMMQWRLADPRGACLIPKGDAGHGFESIVKPIASNGEYSLRGALRAILREWLGACRGFNPNPTPFPEVRMSIDLITECYRVRQPLRLDCLAFEE